MNILGRNVPRKNVPRLVIMSIAGIILITFAVAVCSTLCGIHDVRRKIQDCEEAIALRQSELKQLEQKKAYYESREFLEDSARSGGYVGEDETVFVVTN